MHNLFVGQDPVRQHGRHIKAHTRRMHTDPAKLFVLARLLQLRPCLWIGSLCHVEGGLSTSAQRPQLPAGVDEAHHAVWLERLPAQRCMYL